MKLEIQANDFCPDNCLMCEPRRIGVRSHHPVWICENGEKCRYLLKLQKGEEDQNELTHSLSIYEHPIFE